MIKKQTIVHCLNHYLPSHMAGTEIYTHTLIREQKEAGHDVSVLIPHFAHEDSGPYIEKYRYDGVDVYQYRETSSPADRAIVLGRKEPNGLGEFTAILAEKRPGLVQFHELNRSIGLRVGHVKAAKQAGAAVFLTMHLSGYTCNTNVLVNNDRLCPGKILEYDCTVCSLKNSYKLPKGSAQTAASLGTLAVATGLDRLLPAGKAATLLSMPRSIRRIKDELRQLTEHTDQLISLTEWYKKILIENGVPEDKITVIPQRLAAAARRPAHDSGDPDHTGGPTALPIKLVFVGRIQPQKGVDLLIDAMTAFAPGQLTLDIYGKPEQTAYDTECQKKTADQPQIRWMGTIERDEVVETLTRYDLLCLPSTFSEMSPLVIQEAFAAGIPVLASEVYGNIEQIDPGHNGLLFAFGNTGSLIKQLQSLVGKPSRIDDMKKNITPPDTFEDTGRRYQALIEKYVP